MPDLPAQNSNPLWEYSLALYQSIEPWCLQMQDQQGANVNLLLLCCFAGSQGYRLSPQQLAEATQTVGQWDSAVIQPLRQLRRQSPGPSPALLSSLPPEHRTSAQKLFLNAEIEAERYAQQLLWQWWQKLCQQQPPEHAGACADSIAINLGLYGKPLNMPPAPPTVIHYALRAGG